MDTNLKNNPFYIENKSVGSYYDIEDYVLNLMVLQEEGIIFDTYLHFVKKMKELTGLGLYYIKGYSDLIRDLGFVKCTDEKVYIESGIIYIRSYQDIIKMIDENITYTQLVLISKIKRIKNKIK